MRISGCLERKGAALGGKGLGIVLDTVGTETQMGLPARVSRRDQPRYRQMDRPTLGQDARIATYPTAGAKAQGAYSWL